MENLYKARILRSKLVGERTLELQKFYDILQNYIKLYIIIYNLALLSLKKVANILQFVYIYIKLYKGETTMQDKKHKYLTTGCII